MQSRYAVLVSQHPLNVVKTDLATASMPLSDREWMLATTSSTLQAVGQSRRGREHWVLREDSPTFDYQPSRIAEERLGPWPSKTILGPDEFDEFAELFMSTSEKKIAQFILMAEKLVPEMQIAPARIHDLMQREGYGRLPRYFRRHELDSFEALVWLARSANQLPKKELDRLQIDIMPCIHLGGGWYAFEKIDDAMAVKLASKNTEVHPLRD